ncbi:hypothetical protein GPECTOR_363g138 [Gonium pectorale]|uniref:Peptidase M48 domain-containing protein n=1 Tax=Gonium pectorale TaxID=33097 RepID=A0A150FVH4_GONPE|nr:hypothetical protein GPECTOR_363g138 [Gonium pectorale]|eukprot:KXZ41612.1 hypothetical protein GPECTOR_363g138 [Gonium pectorale]
MVLKTPKETVHVLDVLVSARSDLHLPPDELAFVIGHEVAHLLAKHHVDNLHVRLYADPLVWFGWLKRKAVSSTPITTNTFRREREFEADEIGMHLMARAGFNPEAAVRAMERAAKSEEQYMAAMRERAKRGDVDAAKKIEGFNTTHPPARQRVERLRQHLPAAMKAYRDYQQRTAGA